MIQDFERYHGVVLRAIIVGFSQPLTIEQRDYFGRINSFLLNDKVAVHIKHSSKRLPPWQFSLGVEQLQELQLLAQDVNSVWLALVCGPDGIVSLSLREFVGITETRPGGVASIRVDRSRGEMYRIYGNSGPLQNAKPRGVTQIVNELTALFD